MQVQCETATSRVCVRWEAREVRSSLIIPSSPQPAAYAFVHPTACAKPQWPVPNPSGEWAVVGYCSFNTRVRTA